MTKTTRVLVVMLGLMGLGALAGTIIAVTMLEIMGIYSPGKPPVIGNLDIGFIVGGSIGAILGPTISFGLMRRVPIWRAVLETTAGALIGSGLGLLMYKNGIRIPWSPITEGAICATLAAMRLKWAYRNAPAIGSPQGNGAA